MKSLLVNTSNWKFIIPALLGFICCIYLFQKAQLEMSEICGEEVEMIDMRSNYTLDEINSFFTQLGPEGRKIHQRITGVTDMIFPFAYGLLFILLAALLLKNIAGPTSNWIYLSLIPILLMIVDYIENFNTLNMLKRFPDLTGDMVTSAANVTGIKSMLTSISMGLPVLLGLVWIIKIVSKKMRK